MIDTQKLRQRILDLAIRGRLVPQDPADEPASVLLERIRAEKQRLIAEGKIKRPKAKKTADTSHYPKFTPPFPIPDSWQWVTLGEICEIKGGTTISKEDELPEGEIMYLKVSDFNSPQNTEVIKTSNRYANKYNESQVIKRDSILFPKRGGAIFTNKKRINRTEILADLNIMSVHPIISFDYVYIWFLGIDLGTIQSGSNIPQINNQDLEPLLIPLPPLEEQKRIVRKVNFFLYLIDTLNVFIGDLTITVKSAKAKILELAMQGRLVTQGEADEPAAEMLRRVNPKARIIADNPHYPQLPTGWCLCKLRDLCSFLSRGKSPKYSETPNRYPVFAQKCNLKDGGISLSQARFLDEGTIHKWSNKYHLADGDVLVNSTGTGTVGRTRIFYKKYLGNYPFVVPDSHVSVVRCYEGLSSEFVYYTLISTEGQQYFAENLAGSTNQKELYIDVIGEKTIALPPLAEQKRIVAKIEELYAVLDQIEASLCG